MVLLQSPPGGLLLAQVHSPAGGLLFIRVLSPPGGLLFIRVFLPPGVWSSKLSPISDSPSVESFKYCCEGGRTLLGLVMGEEGGEEGGLCL